ncbi:alpha-mannosidase At3g26720-like [Phalaenopsis equestris]|uniref:alpha-mannosidase At3g26720-like n=1 Tax=Phalaenopsis equestris TaxID=78828 RepID=UPI0009E4B005|nr:alpha-mannosidase At3g26720-like [Phalaenopsis equestris]
MPLYYFIQGKFYLRIDLLGEGAKWRRTTGQEIYSPLLVAFSEQDGGNWVNSHVPKFSATESYCLPENVALITLQALDDESVLLRLAHLYELDEDKDLSKMATVDLRKLFPDKMISKITETNLSANQERSEMEKKRLKWKVRGTSRSKSVVRGRPVDSSKLLVELGPMEIRTFLLNFLDARRQVVD